MSELARASSERGEVVLRERESDGAVELRVNGVFVMDDRETSSERILARATLDALPARVSTGESTGLEVLIGGLGLGFTLSEVLADARVGRVVVAEIEGALVDWHRTGLVPAHTPAAPVLADPRVDVVVGDVRAVVASAGSSSLDIILLDVDNGPGFLVYEENAALYADEFLETCRRAIRPDGIVAVWSASAAPSLLNRLEAVFGRADDWTIPVILGQRATTYHLCVGHA